MCFSSHDRPENIIRLIDSGEFAGMLVQYNLLDRHYEEVIAYASDRGATPRDGGDFGSPVTLAQKAKEANVWRGRH